MRRVFQITGLGFAFLNALLFVSNPRLRVAVDAAYGRLDVPLRPMVSYGVPELLVYYDPWLAQVVFPLIFTVGFACVPFLLTESRSETSRAQLPAFFAPAGLLALNVLEVVWLFLIGIGLWCRGPNWVFYWPGETWDLSRLEALNSVNLSEYVWIQWFRTSPADLPWIVRESPGVLLLAVYFGGGILLPLFLHGRKPGLLRLLPATLLLQAAFLVPLKMACRYFFDLKYFVAIGENYFYI